MTTFRKLFALSLFTLALTTPAFASETPEPLFPVADNCLDSAFTLTAEGGGDPVELPVVDPRICYQRCKQVYRACFNSCGANSSCQASCDDNYWGCMSGCPGGGL